MENVKNFETHDYGKTLSVVSTTMKQLGYRFYKKVLNAVALWDPTETRKNIYGMFQK